MNDTRKDRAGDGASSGSGNPVLALCLVGGGIAWLLHLLAAVVVAEFGCVAGLGEVRFFGINAVAWMLIFVSLVTFAGGVAATILSYRVGREVSCQPAAGTGSAGRLFTARTALITNLIFVFVIVMQSVPIVYFLHDC